MAGNTPDNWLEQDVIVYFRGDEGRADGKLDAFTDAGVVLRTEANEADQFAFYPMTTIHRIVPGKPPKTGAPIGVGQRTPLR